MTNPVWSAMLDGTYDVMVEALPDDPARGLLVIMRGNKVLKAWDTPISYGAQFGPDVGDIWAWQTVAMEYIDSLPKTEPDIPFRGEEDHD